MRSVSKPALHIDCIYKLVRYALWFYVTKVRDSIAISRRDRPREKKKEIDEIKKNAQLHSCNAIYCFSTRHEFISHPNIYNALTIYHSALYHPTLYLLQIKNLNP